MTETVYLPCTRCGKILPETSFQYDKHCPGRRNRKSWCLACFRKYDREKKRLYRSGVIPPKKRWYLTDTALNQTDGDVYKGVVITIGKPVEKLDS
jgi:hypothetical protein